MRRHPKIFDEYTESVQRYRQEEGVDWTVELKLDRQTKLDEWREYYISKHRKSRALERGLERVRQELEPAQERMREAERNGSVGLHGSALWRHWADLAGYNQRMAEAQTRVGTAQKKVEASRADGSPDSAKRAALIGRTEQDLELARQSLEAEKSARFEQLNKELERDQVQTALQRRSRSVDWAQKRLEEHDALLQWIAGQTAEILPATTGPHHHPPLPSSD